MKTFLTFLSRNKAYTAVNVLGLSLSLMFVILIGTYAWQEYHVNAQYPKADRILVYTMQTSWEGSTEFRSGGHWRLQQHFRARYPEIENSCAFTVAEETSYKFGDERKRYVTMFTDSTFFSMLDIPFIMGGARTAFGSPDAAVVTDEFARKVYGSAERAMGQQLYMEDSVRLRITAVIPQFRHSSVPRTDVLVRYEQIELFNRNLTAEGMNSVGSTEVLFLQRKGAHLERDTTDIDKFQKQFFWLFQDKEVKCHTVLVPLDKFYFTKGFTVPAANMLQYGNAVFVNMLVTVGLVILLFAVFNYINLTNAISDRRAREMAMRRLVGARRKDVVARLIVESVLLCTVSMIVAMFLAWAAVPYTERLLHTSLTLVPLGMAGAGRVAALVGFTVALGVVSGMLPASVISKAKPIDVVRGTFHFNTHQHLSKVFIVIQNTATIVLIAVSAVMSGQINHLIHMPRGYNTKNLMEVRVSGVGGKLLDAWYDGLRQLPQVVAVTACEGTPYDGGYNNTFVFRGKYVSTQSLRGDANYMKLFGLKATRLTGLKSGGYAGYYDAGSDIYVNRQMLQEEGLPINSRYFYSFDEVGDGKHPHRENVSGLLEDFHMRDIGDKQHPLFLVINPKFRA